MLDELVATEEFVLEAAGGVAGTAGSYHQGRSDFFDLMVSGAARRSRALPSTPSTAGQTGSKERSSSGIQAIEHRPGTPPPRHGRRAGESPAVVASRRSLDGNRMRRTHLGGSGSPPSCTGSDNVSGSDARCGLANTSGSGGAGCTAAASAVGTGRFRSSRAMG